MKGNTEGECKSREENMGCREGLRNTGERGAEVTRRGM